MPGIDVLVEAIEFSNPRKVSLFLPRFSIVFLWKLIDELSIYRRKNLEEFSLYITGSNSDEESFFSLNECIEIQDFFSNVKIYLIKNTATKYSNNLLPGFLYVQGSFDKAYSFEVDFSTSGFKDENPLIATSVIKIVDQLSHLSKESFQIDRNYLNEIKTKKTNSSRLVVEIKNSTKASDFSLWFVSSRTKKIHNAGAGLNWGQPTASRKRKDKNAAYLPVPTFLQKSLNLPAKNQLFLCKFDDGVEIEMVRTGENGKNLTSAHENQIFGRYVRFKLSVPSGQTILQSDLEKSSLYGLSFFKKSDNSYDIKYIHSLDTLRNI